MGQLSCGPRTKMDALSLGVLRHRSTISLRCKNVTSSRMAGFMATSGEDVVVMIPDATTDSYVSKFDLTIKWLGGGGVLGYKTCLQSLLVLSVKSKPTTSRARSCLSAFRLTITIKQCFSEALHYIRPIPHTYCE